MFEFSNKVVLITGAGSGIGAGIAKKLAKLGANLVLIDLNFQGLEEAKKDCQTTELAGQILISKADVTKENDLDLVVDQLVKEFGKLDCLINCAGILVSGTVENTSVEMFNKVFEVNVQAVFVLTQKAIPLLIKTKGSIVNISSVASTRASANYAAYSMSKAAIDNFTNCLAITLAPKGVRCNTVNPGAVETELYKNSGFSDAKLKDFKDNAAKVNPLGRMAKIEDVVNAVIFLASSEAEYITGAHFPVDGGRNIA